jgi:formamidopyrimidine-DNA glycosylase
MPELPEVETLRRDLNAALLGRRILSVHILDHKLLTGSPEITGHGVTGHRIGRIGRRGKVLILSLDGSGSLLIHPKMTGQLIVTVAGATVIAGGHPTPSMLEPMPNATTRAVFGLDQATRLYYNDARRFGWIRLAGPRPCATDPFLSRLGPEPLTEAFTVAALREGLTRHARAPVKAVLLDQSVVAGIGNIYAGESLHHARIHPARRAGSLSPEAAPPRQAPGGAGPPPRNPPQQTVQCPGHRRRREPPEARECRHHRDHTGAGR